MRCWKTICCSLLAAGLTTQTIAANPFSTLEKLKDLPARWAPLMDDLHVPGAAIAVIHEGKVYSETFGYRNAEQSLPIDADTLFYIGSITKTYTTATLIALAEAGGISLDDRVVDLIPDFQLSDTEVQEAIRVRDLLTHRYGINAPIAEVRLAAYTGEYTQQRFLYWMSRAFVRGETDYGNEHFEIAGRIIEAVTGQDWREYMQETLLAPAGLERTTGYASVLWDDENAAVPLLPSESGYRLPDQLKTDRTMHPAGGLGTSLNDAVRFLKLHMNLGVIEGKRLLPGGPIRETMTLQTRYPEPEGNNLIEIGRTLGWETGRWAGNVPVVYHGGGYSGALAWYAILPEQEAGIVFLMNSNVPASAWYRLVISDLLIRLSGVAPENDPYKTLLAQIDKGTIDGMIIGPAPPPAAISSLPADSLSMPAGLYAGYFHSEHLGTLIVKRCKTSLCFQLGDAPIPVESDDGRDTFQIPEFIRSKGRFVVSPNGEVNTVVIEADGESFGRHEFSR